MCIGLGNNEKTTPEQVSQENKSKSERKISFAIDPETGRSIANATNVDTGESIIDDISISIANILSDVFKNYGRDIIPDIEASVDSNDFNKLYETLEQGHKMGILSTSSKETIKEIHNLLRRVDSSNFTGDRKKRFFEFKLAFASEAADFVGLYDEASEYLIDNATIINESIKNSIILAQANSASQEGKQELAYSLYKHIIKNSTTDYANLAWAYSGLAATLGDMNPDMVSYKEKAADYFLLCGKKKQYANCKVRLADILKGIDPHRAIKMLDDAISIFDNSNDLERDYITSLKLTKAKIYDYMGLHDRAFNEIKNEIDVNRLNNYFGNEAQLISTLNAAIIFSNQQKENDTDFISKAKNAINVLEQRMLSNDKIDYELRNKFIAALNTKDLAELQQLQDAILSSNDTFQIVFYWILVILIGHQSFTEKLLILENILKMIESQTISSDVKAIIYVLFAETFLENGDEIKAIDWYEKSLLANPFQWHCIQNCISLLWKNNLWKEASIFIESKLALFDDSPNLLFAYGKSLVEMKEYNKAVPILRKVQKLLPDMTIATEYLNRALDMCGDKILFEIDNQVKNVADISIEDIKELMVLFANFIRDESRMTFWKVLDGKKHSWTPSPEKHGQNLLHTFIKAKYGDDVEVFEEISTGAGRIDLYICFSNGFKAVIELKMCGHGYSSGYSIEGIEQINHYLNSKKLHIGFLLVFDSRSRDNAKGIDDVYHIDDKVIYSFIADVRPLVK